MKNLHIKGIQKMSLVDFEPYAVTTLFFGNCNWRCPYCQNPDLITKFNELPDINPEEVLEFLKSRKKWIDGVCITGGEPTLNKDLPDFIKKIKEIGLLVKFDTNGSNPKMLEHLIKDKIIDYIAMDIKSSLEGYDNATKVKVNKGDIKKSVELIKKKDIDYEFRITVVPDLFNKEDADKMGKWLKGAKRFYIQQFRGSMGVLDLGYANKNPFSAQELREFRGILKKYMGMVEIRGL